MEKKHILIALAAIMLVVGFCLLMTSCSGHYARLSKEEVITSFPETYILPESSMNSVEVPGVVDIKHIGERLYCMTMNPQGLIVVLDDKGLEPCGVPFLRLGNGPLETLSPIPFRQMFFHEEDGCVLADFFNMGNRLIRLNLTLSESENAIVGQPLGEVPGELMGMGPLSILEDGVFFFQTPLDQSSVRRGIWSNGEIQYAQAQEKLNSFALQDPDGFMFNIFFSTFAYNSSLRRFVEASTMQNTVNLYDLDGPFAKTLSIGGPVKDYYAMEKAGMEGLVQTSQSVQAFPDFFAVLYFERPLSSPPSQKPVLMFFDWDGRPLLEISLPGSFTGFDIDREHGILYLSDQREGKVAVADISMAMSHL